MATKCGQEAEPRVGGVWRGGHGHLLGDERFVCCDRMIPDFFSDIVQRVLNERGNRQVFMHLAPAGKVAILFLLVFFFFGL